MEVITGIRNIRGEMNLNPGLKLNVLVKTSGPEIQKILQTQASYIRELARVEQLQSGPEIEKPQVSASSVIGEMDLIIPLEGMMDFQEERNRVEKELKKIKKDLIFLDKKLSNPNFVKKAPAEVIEKDEQRKTTLSEKQAKLEIHLKTIEQGIG
jgi:valyl-tRNA synthetase